MTDNRLLHIIYGLYVATFFLGFAFIVGVALAYWLRGHALSNLQRSHVEWQIRTFWLTFFYGLVVLITAFIFGSLTVMFIGIGLLYVWYIYRVVRGWLRLRDGRPVLDPSSFL